MKKYIMFIPFCLIVANCTTVPDPEKICTANWIEPRAEAAISRIENRVKSTIKPLKSVGESLAKGKTPNVFSMMRLNSSFERLETELTEGRGIKDIRFLAKTCNDPEIIKKSVRTVFERQGLSTIVLDFIENLDVYKSIIEQNLERIDVFEDPINQNTQNLQHRNIDA